jgi:hypothetical protein
MTFTTYLWIVSGLLFVWAVYLYASGIIQKDKEFAAKREEMRLRDEYGDEWYDSLKAKVKHPKMPNFIKEKNLRAIREADNELKKQ